jgi:hypothetical protein
MPQNLLIDLGRSPTLALQEQAVATRAKLSAKNVSGEYATFETALKKVLSVPRSALKAQLDAEKRVRKLRRKRASGHASVKRTRQHLLRLYFFQFSTC